REKGTVCLFRACSSFSVYDFLCNKTVSFYFRGQRAKRTCLHVHLVTAARVKYSVACCRGFDCSCIRSFSKESAVSGGSCVTVQLAVLLRFYASGRCHSQLRTSSRSWPYSAMYCLCSMSLSFIFWIRCAPLLPSCGRCMITSFTRLKRSISFCTRISNGVVMVPSS